MRTLHISVNNKVATYIQRDGHIVCGNSDYLLKFTFDSEWDDQASKTARFIWNGKYYDQAFTGDTCIVPIITGAEKVEVGVYAGELKTTTPATIPCEKSILCGTNTVQDVVIPDYKDQTELAASQAINAAAEAKAAAEEAKEAAASAGGGGAVDAYTKAETYNKTEVDAKFEALPETYSKAELVAMFGAYVTDMANLIGGEALADS